MGARAGDAHGRLRGARRLGALGARELSGDASLAVREVADGQHNQLGLRWWADVTIRPDQLRQRRDAGVRERGGTKEGGATQARRSIQDGEGTRADSVSARRPPDGRRVRLQLVVEALPDARDGELRAVAGVDVRVEEQLADARPAGWRVGWLCESGAPSEGCGLWKLYREWLFLQSARQKPSPW